MDQRQRPSFRRLADPPLIPLLKVEPDIGSGEAEVTTAEDDGVEDLRILTHELNTGFETASSLLRCTVIQPSAPPVESGERSPSAQSRYDVRMS
jgi:hypothetical protein